MVSSVPRLARLPAVRVALPPKLSKPLNWSSWPGRTFFWRAPLGWGWPGICFWRRPCWDWKFVTWGVR
jgi:hypothetical protein